MSSGMPPVRVIKQFHADRIRPAESTDPPPGGQTNGRKGQDPQLGGFDDLVRSIITFF
jgi:hypothetical protein